MIHVIMGVTGCGKSTVGAALARRREAVFLEGDAFHPGANRRKMAAGQPLTDADRSPWLAALHEAMVAMNSADRPGVVACSALKRRYRAALADGLDAVRFVYLQLTAEEATRRLEARTEHFMPASLVPSQFAALEPPGPDEALVLDATLRNDALVLRIMEEMER